MKINNRRILIYKLRIVLLVLIIFPMFYVSSTDQPDAIPDAIGIWAFLAAFFGTPFLILDIAYSAKLLLFDPLPGRQIISVIVLSFELVALFYYIYFLLIIFYLSSNPVL